LGIVAAALPELRHYRTDAPAAEALR